MNEKGASQKALTPQEEKIKNIIEQGPEIKDVIYEGADRVINKNTITRLESFLGLEDDKFGVGKKPLPYYKAFLGVKEWMDDLGRDPDTAGTRSWSYQVRGWLNKLPSGNDYYYNPQDATSVGMYLIFKAFEIQNGRKFIDNLRRAKPKEVMEAFDFYIPRIRSSTSAVERSFNNVVIPDGQILLNDLLNKFVQPLGQDLASHVEQGAVLGYKVIDKLKLWSVNSKTETQGKIEPNS